ncbi:MAG: DUF4397 domain-containing protein [Flavobacteriaceae bacterium]
MKKLTLSLTALLTTFFMYSQARVQVIHNSADAAATQVDVYLDDTLTLDDFAFRTATPFIDFPADVEVVIGIAPANSTSSSDVIASFPVTLADGETYVVVADGIVSPTGYNPPQPFGLQVYALGREAATVGTNTDVLVHHGSTDAPTVDVVETGVGAGLIVDDISYTEFQGYLELPTADYVLQINAGGAGVAAFSAPLGTLGLDGQALVVVASGFLDPSQNSNGPAFGLWVALASGGDLVELPAAALGTTEFLNEQIALFPNPVQDMLTVSGLEQNNYTYSVVDMLGRTILKLTADQGDTLNVANLNTGIYNLVISEGTTILGSKRFIKN